MDTPVYDFDDITAAADCAEILRTQLGGVEISPGRFNCPWRPDSDSGAFAVTREGWYDHVTKEHGGVLKLVQRVMFPLDAHLMETQEWLGNLLNLTPKASAKERSHRVCEYVYTDAAGAPLHKTIRWEPKRFTQAALVDGQWRNSLEGVATVLYRLPEVLAGKASKRWIFLCEGEKDADNLAAWGLVATTSPMGAGKWCDAYTDALAGANVCQIVDKDEPGRAHRDLVCPQLLPVVAALKAIELPGANVKDFTDWRDAGGDQPQFVELVRQAEPWAPAVVNEYTKDLAKECNATPFKNFRVLDRESSRGTERVKEPVHINKLVSEVLRRFLGFPRRIGDMLFDHDRKTGHIRYFEAQPELFAWISEKSGQPVQWAKIEGAASQEHLFHSLRENVQRYELISGVPNWPKRADVYYTHGDMPAPDPDCKRFNEFMAFFHPATAADAFMLRAFFASVIYYRYKVDRPLWIIDSIHGQGSGKTKLVETAAQLTGGFDADQSEPIWADANELTNEQTADRVKRRLLSRSGRKKRVFLVDNVTGYFASPTLSCMVTQGSLSGIAPYGRGEETRPNDITYVLTANSASVDKDLSARAFYVNIRKPEQADPQWNRKLTEFIRRHRLQIISDIIGILERGPAFDAVPVTRFKLWEKEVLQPMCGTLEDYSGVIKVNCDRLAAADGELEQVDTIRDAIREQLRQSGVNPETETAFISNDILRAWCRDAIPEFGGRSGRSIPNILRNWHKAGMLSELSERIQRWPLGGMGPRGMAWNCPDIVSSSMPIKVISKEATNDAKF